jgi:hypothetical protein
VQEAIKQIQLATRYGFSGLVDTQNAIAALSKKTATTTTTVVATSAAGGGGGGGGGSVAGSIGVVNEQSTGAYTLVSGDFGAIVVLDTAPTFALTLASLTAPFFCIISNQCTGVAILTPDQPSISVNGFSSWPVPPGGFAIVAFDGTNWWAVPVCPGDTPAIPANFLTAYDSATGVFSQGPVTELIGVVTVDSGASIICDSGSTIIFDSGSALVCEPGSSLSLLNLQIFANNGAAVAGGLVAGNVYRLGGDPDLLAVVH